VNLYIYMKKSQSKTDTYFQNRTKSTNDQNTHIEIAY